MFDWPGGLPGCTQMRTEVRGKDYYWSMGLVYDPRELPEVMTAKPRVAGVLQLLSPSWCCLWSFISVVPPLTLCIIGYNGEVVKSYWWSPQQVVSLRKGNLDGPSAHIPISSPSQARFNPNEPNLWQTLSLFPKSVTLLGLRFCACFMVNMLEDLHKCWTIIRASVCKHPFRVFSLWKSDTLAFWVFRHRRPWNDVLAFDCFADGG
jgi:hypothetical protein